MENSEGRDVLGMSAADRAWTVVLLGGGGAVLLGLLPWLFDLLDGIPHLPFRDVVEWFDSFDQWWAPALRVGTGLAAGIALAMFAIVDEHRLEVGDDALVLVHGDDRRTVTREQVVGIHRAGKKITIDGTQGRVIFDQKLEVGRDDVRAAFVSRGWPWESD